MKPCALFLHGRYIAKDIPFYTRICRGKFCVAVDGGYRFFRLSGIIPDLLIGDFDSLKRMPRNLSPRTAVEKFSPAKDKTDAHLALEYCLKRRAPKIDIVQPSFGEPDQFMGNLMLLAIPLRGAKSGYNPEVRIVNPRYEASLVSNTTFSLSGAKGVEVSVIPMSSRVTYSCRGTEYVVSNVALRQGDTRALRNRVTAARARFDIVGKAFVIRQYGFDRA